LRIACAEGSNWRANSSGVRPFRTNATIRPPELRRVRRMALRHRGPYFPPQRWGVHETGPTPGQETARSGASGRRPTRGTQSAATPSLYSPGPATKIERSGERPRRFTERVPNAIRGRAAAPNLRTRRA
jgi:hypothetical protein